jgi:chorismate-pyruvate lyase
MTSAAELSERLLRADSATRELEQWCQQHGIGDGRIVAIRQADESPERLDDHSLDVLNNYRAAKSASFRRVRLITAGIAVVEALNWYFPANLTAEMREQLLTTEMPFGHVIAQLHPRRHTFFVRHSPPARQAGPQQGANGSPFAFEHHAIVRSVDASPLAIVHERFLTTLLHPTIASVDGTSRDEWGRQNERNARI